MRSRHSKCVATCVQPPLSCMSSLQDACLAFSILQHVPSKSGDGVLAWPFGLFLRASMAFDGRGGCLTRLRYPMGGVDMLLPKGCKRSAVLFRRGDQLPYLPTSTLIRVMMPPTRMSRNSGVGPSVFGISDVDVPNGVGWGSPLGGGHHLTKGPLDLI